MAQQFPKLVLMPGLDGTGELFAPLLAVLPPEINTLVVTYSLQAELSYPAMLKEVADKLPDEPYILIAESFSTPLAVHLAALHPTNLLGLMLCAGFVSSPLTRQWAKAASLLAPLLFRIPPQAWILRCALLGTDADVHSIEMVRKAIASVPADVLTARLRLSLACDARADLRSLRVPILLIQPTADRLVSRRSMEEMCKLNRSAQVEWITGPHLILQRHPEMAAHLLLAFISQTRRV